MSNFSSLTYADIFNQNGGHTAQMWTILGVRSVISCIGIGLNISLVMATIKSENLRSVCNWLIALDSGCLALFQLHSLITFGIAVSGINVLPLFPHCFILQVLPLLGILIAFPTMIQVGLERLGAVLFPFWSAKAKFKIVHLFLVASSIVSTLCLIGLNYLAHQASSSKMVMCWGTDITNVFGSQFYAISHTRTFVMHGLVVVIYVLIWAILKAKNKQKIQNFSQNVFKSLLVLVIVELIGWFPALFMGDLIKMAGIDPVQATYLSTSYSTMSILTSSANAPTLYYFSQTYRKAINSVLTSIGLKKPFTHGPTTKMGMASQQNHKKLVMVQPMNVQPTGGPQNCANNTRVSTRY